MRSVIKLWLLKLLDCAGFPLIVRECDYRSEGLGTKVRVKKLAFSTLVSVNGVDVYFNRITGAIDGAGFSPNVCCTSDKGQLSTDFAAQLDTSAISAHTRSIEG